MRTVRLVIAALVALALAVLPMMFAGSARQPAGKAEMGAEMSMSTPDDACPGCDATHHRADVCGLKCCGIAAMLVEAQPLTARRRLPSGDMVAAAFAPLMLPPDPPPPRS